MTRFGLEAFGLGLVEPHVGVVNDRLLDLVSQRGDRLGRESLEQVRGGGKRLRPALCIAAAQVAGAPFDEDVCLGSVAVELVHTGSLVHDDIIDLAPSRRGVPTLNGTIGADFALLAGDYLLGLAGLAAARVSQEVATVLAETIVVLSVGQDEELGHEYDPARDHQSVMRAIEGKTVALLEASCRIGALAGRIPEPQVDALAAYGRAYGYLFQLVDDVMDFASSEELLRKPVGNDVMQGVYTLPLLHLLESDPKGAVAQILELGRERHEEWRAAQTGLSWSPEAPTVFSEEERQAVVTAVREADVLHRVLSEARTYARTARAAIDGAFQPTPLLEGLIELPDLYISQQVRTLAPWLES